MEHAGRRFPRPASPDLFGGSPGVARNFQVFDALDFIAEITQHVPDARTSPSGRRTDQHWWFPNAAATAHAVDALAS